MTDHPLGGITRGAPRDARRPARRAAEEMAGRADRGGRDRSRMSVLPPGSTIGILGGGQLGRMLAVAAAQLGYHTRILAPDAESVAAQTASSFTRADYHSRIVLDELAASADVVTYEFENIALEPISYLATQVPVYPPPAALSVAQDRAVEKSFVGELGGKTAPWRKVTSLDELRAALAEIGDKA